MKLLLDDRLAPLTSEIGFLECDAAQAAHAYFAWQKEIAPAGVQVASRPIADRHLEGLLRQLLPLTTILPTRALFVASQGPWSAFLTNAAQGTDAVAPMSFLAKELGVRGLRITAVPEPANKGESKRFGATVLEIYGPEEQAFLNYVRSIACANDGVKWTFVVAGAPQPFERPEHYKARKVRDRFTLEMLGAYAAALGVTVFDEAFYDPSRATLIEKTGALPPASRERSLDEVRSEF